MEFKILFKNGQAITETQIIASVKKFYTRFGYQITVREIIKRLAMDFNREIFFKNSAQLMTNFKMTRSGIFKGIKYNGRNYFDPNGVLETCWKGIGKDLVSLRAGMSTRYPNRTRTLADIDDTALDEITTKLWEVFTKKEQGQAYTFDSFLF